LDSEFQGLLTSDEDGEFAFVDFVKDTQMAYLYEKFVLKFYQSHLNAETYKVYAPRIKYLNLFSKEKRQNEKTHLFITNSNHNPIIIWDHYLCQRQKGGND